MAAGTQGARKKSDDGIWDTVKVVLQALLIAFVIRTFFFQPFNIPSGSMIPTLRIGDYLFVNKLSYGYGKYSFNLAISIFGLQLPKIGPMPFEGRIFADTPERGDVVVFKLPSDNETDYIKRVVGLPNDRIQVVEGVLHINGQAVKREKIADYTTDNGEIIRRFRETLPNNVTFNTLDKVDGLRQDNTQEYVVPAGHYFMMGDNRDNSTDSRVLDQVGFVPYENLVGKANVIFFSHRQDASIWQIWRWPAVIRWGRIFGWVK